MLKIFYAVIFILLLMPTAWAHEAESIANSRLTGARLPANALRLGEQSVPAEVTQVLREYVKSGGAGVRQGASETLVWTGGDYRKTNAPNLIRNITDDLRASGWTYEVAGKSGALTMFSLMKSAPTRRGILGFYNADDKALVLAWTEMLPADSNGERGVKKSVSEVPAKTSTGETRSANTDSAAVVLNVGKNDSYVNVMGNKMPEMPQFPALKAKAGFVRGYVKDWTGKPLQGATIGIRASYFAGHYSGAQGKTDAKGFYEFAVPKGSAHFYNAGYAMEWGDGLAAVGLHPADGSLDSFVTMEGGVENFVLLPYGITSRANAQDNPQNSISYYGGAIYIFYGAFGASDNNPYAGYVPEDSIIEITLASETGQSFVIRKTAGFQSLFRINNIPLARYQISAKVNGKSLKLKQTGVFDEMFGLKPRETTGAASLLFAPDGAKSEMVAPQSGSWKAFSINLESF